MLEQRLAIRLMQYAEELKEYRAALDAQVPESAELFKALDDLTAVWKNRHSCLHSTYGRPRDRSSV